MLDELRVRGAELFPAAVRFAVENPDAENPSLNSLHQLCSVNYKALGFFCHNDCFAEIVPKLENRISLVAWCRADVVISGWAINLRFRPFYLGAGYGHYEVRHNGDLPGFTNTGYRSVFTPLATFAECSPEEYLASLIPQHPREHQLSLF